MNKNIIVDLSKQISCFSNLQITISQITITIQYLMKRHV